MEVTTYPRRSDVAADAGHSPCSRPAAAASGSTRRSFSPSKAT